MSKQKYAPDNVTVKKEIAFPIPKKDGRSKASLQQVFETNVTQIKLDAYDTVELVKRYLLTQKFAGEDSAKSTSNKVGTLIRKYGIIRPDIQNLRKLVEEMEDAELENTTRRSYLYAIQVWAEALGKPLDLKQVVKRLPPLKQNMVQALPADILKKAYDICQGQRDQTIFKTGAYTGLRNGELCRLRIEDVDPDNDVIHVRNHGRQTLKNRRERDVPIPDELKPNLIDWLAVRNRFMQKKGTTSEYFFITVKGQPMEIVTVGEMMRDIKKKLGLPKNYKFTFHQLRHTCNSQALASGISINECIENFGWSDAKIAVRYSHADIEKRKESMKNFSYGVDH